MSNNEMTLDLDVELAGAEPEACVHRPEIAQHIAAMTSILVDCFNSQASDATKCQKLAEYMAWEIIAAVAFGKRSEAFYARAALDEVIYAYGEPVAESYCGRDEEGEKMYITYNPDTNWETRINKVLYPMLKAAGVE